MKLVESTSTSATIDRVWSVLNQPSLMELWNPKCRKCHAGSALMGPGVSFDVEFVMNGRESMMRCHVAEYVPPKRLELRYDLGGRQGGEVTEEIVLSEGDSGTLIRQVLDLSRSGIPWWARMLMWVLITFGRQTGPGSVDGIKALVERG